MLLRLVTKMQARLSDLRDRAQEERGAAAVEYGLLVALIAAIIVAVVTTLGQKVSNAFSTVANALP